MLPSLGWAVRRMLAEWAGGASGVCLVAVALAAAGCEIATAPAPAGARRVKALPAYALWWKDVETCSALSGDVARVEWYVVPADSAAGGFWCEDGPDHECAGEWVAPHAIYFAGANRTYPDGYAADEWTVKHEMLHDLVGRAGHPEAFSDCHLSSRTPDGVYGLGR